MTTRPSFVLVFASALSSAGCADKTPAAVRFDAPHFVYSTTTESPLSAAVTNKSGEALSDSHASFKVSPESVAVVTQSGGLRCITSGDATVTATAGAITHDEHVACRIVHSVKAPPSLRLTIPNDPIAPAISVLNAAGQPMADVAPTITIADPTIAVVEGGKLRPVAVGTTNAVVMAGDKSATIKLTVANNLKNAPLLLKDGDTLNQPLTQGNYELSIHLTPGSGVTVSWVGGVDCPPVPESGPEITTHCRIPNTGSVIIQNPSGATHVEGWLFTTEVKDTNPPANGNFTLVQIP